MIKKFGENIITNLKKSNKPISICKNFLNYEIIFLKKNKTYNINQNPKILINISKKGEIRVNNYKIKPEEFILSSGNKLKIFSNHANTIAIIASSKAKSKKEILSKNVTKKIKKVNKPWGYEWWYEYKNFDFAFKKIFIKKRYKTSLQYHLYKKEVNLLYDGKIKFHFKKNKRINNKKVLPKDIANIKLENFTSIFVKPKTIHRIEALTDIVLYEASTLQLDDVIRIFDDTNRSNGKINNEHTKSM